MNMKKEQQKPVLISSWEELANLKSDDYYLDIEVEKCNGWVYRKSNDEPIEYLSTHTFYGTQYKYSTVMLQEYGFNVQLKNWDCETEEVNYQDQWLWSGKCDLCRKQKYCTSKCKMARQVEEVRKY